MKEQQQHSRVGCGLEILKDTLFRPSSPPRDDLLEDDDLAFEGRELQDVCASPENEGFLRIPNAGDVCGLCDEFGSHPRLHCEGLGDELTWSLNEGSASSTKSDVHRKLMKERLFSTDIWREEAWERKRDLYHAADMPGDRRRVIGRSISDCSNRSSAGNPRLRTTIRSLTDEDLEELRGCIDLGFGFSDDESGYDLKSTLPALELYYAINRHYSDTKSRSPVSPLDRSSSECSPLGDSWRISSPGDNPSRVKARLRHWAQAVACSIKQGVSP